MQEPILLAAEAPLMGQNTSSAVMQQRREPHTSLDDFPTPPWATRALCEWLRQQAITLDRCSAREPAANRGHMVRPLREYFCEVEASDIFDYGAGFAVQDYLFGPLPAPVDFTITNPPFRLAEQFVERMSQTSEIGFAVFVRTAFLEGIARHANLFSCNPPSHVLQFCERVVIHKGKLVPDGSSATAYAWVVWLDGEAPSVGAMTTYFDWIAPCRKQLELASDYEVAA